MRVPVKNRGRNQRLSHRFGLERTLKPVSGLFEAVVELKRVSVNSFRVQRLSSVVERADGERRRLKPDAEALPVQDFLS